MTRQRSSSGPDPASAPPRSAALFTARCVIDELVRGGLRTICVAPGSRSTPLALAVAERPDLHSIVATDERSMAFLALGIARASGRPVGLVCTSGTAAANFLPAAVESALGGGALVLLTADRPPELRERAAAQTIHQAGLFGAHARWSVDLPLLDANTASARVLRSIASRAITTSSRGGGGPVHVNAPFREPFSDASFAAVAADAASEPAAREGVAPPHPKRAVTGFDPGAREQGRPFTEVIDLHRDEVAADTDALAALASRLGGARRGVVVCAGPAALPAADIVALADGLGWPIVADPLCGLRFGSHDRRAVADAIEPLLRDEALRRELLPDAIVRFGATPAPRSMQRWMDEAWPAEHVVVTADDDWPDPVHAASVLVRGDAASFARRLASLLPPANADAPARPPANADALAGPSGAGAAPAAHLGEVAGAEGEVEHTVATCAGDAIAIWTSSILAASAAARRALDDGMDKCTELFDGAVLRAVVRALPDGASLMIGNSMPVRDADAFVGGAATALRVFANRGASGIDGVVSTALGIAASTPRPAVSDKPETTTQPPSIEGSSSGPVPTTGSGRAAPPSPTVLVLGDLSFLHDAGALLIAARERLPLLLVVVNNDGGAIFSHLPQRELGEAFERFFTTPHGADLEAVAAPLGGRFARVERAGDLDAALRAALSASADGPFVLEVRCDRETSRRAGLALAQSARDAAIPNVRNAPRPIDERNAPRPIDKRDAATTVHQSPSRRNA